MADKERAKYGIETIKVLHGLEGVRRRPAMYIGSTGKEGLHHLVYEVVDNAVDEALAGACTAINITLNKDSSVTVEDNGRGIPVEKHPIHKKSGLEIVMTMLHAGGKFDHKAYLISGGLHGVGVSVVNALSTKVIAKVKRDGSIYEQIYKNGGNPAGPIKVVGKTQETGTLITFFPDDKIFSTIKFDFEVLATRFRELAFLNPGVTITFKDEAKNKKEVFRYDNGLIDFIKWLNKTRNILHKPIYFKKEFDSSILEISIQYNDSYLENIFGFVNTINTIEGGTHISGFKTALTRVINDYAERKGMLKNYKITGDDVREGLTAIVNLRMKDPQFEGQTKTKLGNSEIKGFVDSIVSSALAEFFEENPTIGKKIASKAGSAAQAREAARKARELVRRKTALSISGLPGKLSDCSSNKLEETELYIVEGESAGGSSRQARNKEFQAILPLKGKILNVEKAAPTRVFSSEEIAALITAIGTGTGDQFNIEKLRYGRIILMADADSVTADTPILLFNDKGEISHQYIGDFVDNCINPEKYKIGSFSINPGKHTVKNIIDIVKHPLKTNLYKLKTHLGYEVTITPYHSVFVYSNGKVCTKEIKNITNKDYILLPKKLPRNDKDIIIDLRDLAKEFDIYAEFTKKELSEIPKEAYVNLTLHEWKKIREFRIKSKIIRKKLAKSLNIYPTILQQWEYKIDNVMPKYSLFKKYLSFINYNNEKVKFKLLVPLKSIKNSFISNRHFYFKNHTKGIKLKLELNKELAYLLGWYIGDGNASKGKKNPYRFSLCIGKDKEYYLKHIQSAVKRCLNCNIITEKKKDDTMMIHFNSLTFDLLLKKLRLDRKKAPEKFVPDIIYNAKQEQQLSFLKGLLQSDGSIVTGKKKSLENKAVLNHTTTSKKLMEGIVFLYRQLEILPSVITSKSSPHYYAGVLIKSNYKKYDIFVGSIKQLRKAKEIWKEHKNAHKLISFIKNARKIYGRKHVIDVNDDFQAVRVLKIEKVNSNDKFVYDLSIDLNRSFIGGLGGLTLHNTDGSHIKTLLLTFLFRYVPKLIEAGRVYIAVSPLYKVRKGQQDHYVYSDDELKKLINRLGGKPDVQRFKGLGEMNPQQLWETTMNPKTRSLKKVMIEDAAQADQIFSTLMGDQVQPRREFIEQHAKLAQLDI